MKKSFFLILVCILYGIIAFAQDPAYPLAPAAPQNIVAAEYFIDNDPGFGNGTAVPVSPAVNIINLSPVINVNGLSNGVHRVYLRTRSAEGYWSVAGWKAFLYDFDPAYPTAAPAAQNIIAAEYFIDNDPGIGNGIPITVTPGVNITNLPVTVNTSGLVNGVHRVYLRTKSNEGRWSLTNLKEFIYNDDPVYPVSAAAAQNIVAAEYFVDNDPGFGAATAISVTAATDISNLNVTVNTAGLTNGIHRVYVRTKSNEGRWSLTNLKDFIVNDDPAYPTSPAAAQNIIAAEYFIDNDPGFGAATAISVTAATNISGLAIAANTSGLANGTHRIYVRTKSNEGRWSLTNQQEFIVNDDPAYPVSPAAAQNIIAAEYFIDNDPGVGAGTAISITAATDISNIAVAVNTAGLTIGQHTIYIRTKSNEGRWSLTNNRSFFTDLMAVSEDTLLFGNVPVANTVNRNLTITNNSGVSHTINAVTIAAPFTTNFAGTITIPAGSNHVMQVSFTPSAVQAFEQTMQLLTSAGNYNVLLKGTGIDQLASWTISPATGHNFGNVALSSTGNYTFTIINTGNISVTLSNVSLTDPAFVPTFTAGTVIPAGNSISLPLAFTPTAVGPYSAQLKIESSTAGLSFVTTNVTGSGYNPGAPPVLQFVTGNPYNGNTGVNPVAGQTGTYTYKVLYKSVNNRAPQTGYPKIGIDLNGDQDFVDINEGTFTMNKEGSSTDYVTGVVYSYSYTHNNYTSNAGYRFSAVDDNGNAASTINTNYVSGPVVTDQQLDLRIFANDITFSKNNPAPGETFTVFAKVSNSTALPASNIPIKFYRDTILIAETVLPAVNAFSNATISQTLNFAAEGFYPIKVWIDSSNTLGDINPLNNYAIRPIIVGSPILPGGINVTSSATVQYCPQLKVIISGHAQYYGTQNPTAVAGAEVTINTGTQLITTTTNSIGDYSYALTGVTCGGYFTYNVSVTDFTFTSSLVTNTLQLPCPAPNACAAPVNMGGATATASSNPCAFITGGSGAVNVTVKYRERNISNMWSSWDMIWKDTVKIFDNGVLIETFSTPDDPIFGSLGTFPGDEKSYPVNVSLSTPGTHVITAVATYVYNEFLQIPTSIYHGSMIPMSATGSATLTAQPNLPDLTIQGFTQTGFTAFSLQDANIKCVAAGSHTVKIYDSIPGGAITLIKTSVIGSLSGGSTTSISYSDPTMSAGTHIIKVITDSESTVTETDETNNEKLFTIVVPMSELSITKFVAIPTAIPTGSTTKFVATIKNSGRTTGSFNVRFRVNNVQVGAVKTVLSLGENVSTIVTSDAYTVNYADNACGLVVDVLADVSNTVPESNESNNTDQFNLSADLKPYQLSYEAGSSAGNPVIVRVNTSNQFYPAVRNIGQRDVSNVTVRFTLNSNWLAADTISYVKAGEIYASHASFTHVFSTAGDYVVKVIADTANTICEGDETNNEGNFYIRVVQSKPDFEVLSQYISPSSLNPNLAQNISLVGTVKNMGGQTAAPTVLRFLVDDIQLGAEVPINALLPGKDTTVAATALYSSIISGVKIIKLVADPANNIVEEREDNNLATRAIIVGDAPDMARSHAGAISFNPSGFVAGDSVNVSFIIKNNGTQDGTAWVRFYVKDTTYAAREVDSVQYFLAAGGTITLTKKMFFAIDKGYVITEIDRSNPMEFDLLNNNDTLAFDKVARMKASLTINGNLDMKQGAPAQLPGWIGGKILLNDFDLTVNGIILNYDSAHFIVSNGTGKLKLVNSNAENIYPVGPSLNSMNFMRLNNAGTPDNFSVRVVDYVLRQGTSGDTVQIVTVDRTWFIEESVPGGSNATVEFWWSIAHELPGFDRANCRTAHYTSLWELGDVGAAILASTGQYSKIQTNYTSFSPFTVTSGTDITVPLKLLSFTATLKQNDVQLEWRTADETNTSHFELEYSNDGIHFNKIVQKAAFNTAGSHQYNYLHMAPAGNTIYYRLKQVDNDARFVYSRIIKISRNKLPIVLYPNPAHDFIQLKNIDAAEVKSIDLVSVDGKLISMMLPNYKMRYEIKGLAPGIYFIYIRKKDGDTGVEKFIIE
ncbi:MAG: CARDB domain-containing protein [Ferruginibacter sp.]